MTPDPAIGAGTAVNDDIVIVGGGLAGMFCALKMAPRPVTLITTDRIGSSPEPGAAETEIDPASLTGDMGDAHAADTISAGAGLADPSIVRLLARQAPERLRELADLRQRRDPASGTLLAALASAVREAPSIRLIEGYGLDDLVRDGSRVVGLIATAEQPDVVPAELRLAARAVILASGGIGALYATTTSRAEARGQGLAAAARAGALIADAEFVQFVTDAADGRPQAAFAHFHMGGVLTDANGRTSVDGLWACGEVAATGVHGAGFVAPNDVLEAIVFAARTAEDVGTIYPAASLMPPPQVVARDAYPGLFLEGAAIGRLRDTMSRCVGVARSEAGLVGALSEIAALEREGGPSHGFRNMITAARLIAVAALMRTESRGGHFRSDHPAADTAQARRAILTLKTAEGWARDALQPPTRACA